MNIHMSQSFYSYYAGYGQVSHRRCIDGRITGENRCRGYCEYQGHPGFLTETHISEHQCREKGCYYFQNKDNRIRKMLLKERNDLQIAAALLESCLREGRSYGCY